VIHEPFSTDPKAPTSGSVRRSSLIHQAPKGAVTAQEVKWLPELYTKNRLQGRLVVGFNRCAVLTKLVFLITTKTRNLLRFRHSYLTFNLSHTFPKPRVNGIPLIFLMPDHLLGSQNGSSATASGYISL
jgi:hypothetical protein